METYDYATATAQPAPVGLTGTATYTGGAAGTYTDGSASGMFTARPMLTANFATSMLSGRIDNFMDTSGNYLGRDNADTPNDPVTGGENDWVVLLPASAIGDGTANSPRMLPNGLAGLNTVGGSADGVLWTAGEWWGQLYGPGGRAATIAPPSGVAGSFRAVSPTSGVAGAFGATME